jgi:hypothetical protein
MASIFQKAADWIKSLKTPEWLKNALQEMQDLMTAILITAGKAYLNELTNLIIVAAESDNMSSEQKFKYVVDKAKKSTTVALQQLKDNELNFLVNYLVANLKSKGIIK